MMERISDRISYYPASEEPLSADVFFVKGDECTYIYDVGNGDAALDAINAVSGKKVFILSHFHPDHIGNMPGIDDAFEVYLGKKTFEKLHRGKVVDDKGILINDGAAIEIRRCPSVHAKGSVILTVDREYTFLGDLVYMSGKHNPDLAREMITSLERTDTKFFVLSHEKDKIFEKDELIKRLKEKLLF